MQLEGVVVTKDDTDERGVHVPSSSVIVEGNTITILELEGIECLGFRVI